MRGWWEPVARDTLAAPHRFTIHPWRFRVAARRTALASAALSIMLAAPAAAAAAPVVDTTVQCVRYVDLDPSAAVKTLPTLGVSTSGWSPSQPLTFTVDGATVGNGTAGADGAYDNQGGLFAPPEPKGNLQTSTLSVNGVASTEFRIVRLTVKVPARAKPSQKVKYRVFGFQPNKRVYLFIRRGGRTKGRFALGKPSTECGTLTKRLRYMPLRRWRTGRYEYWYTQDRKYSKATRIYGYRLDIFKTVG
jgi:hypothetical protein